MKSHSRLRLVVGLVFFVGMNRPEGGLKASQSRSRPPQRAVALTCSPDKLSRSDTLILNMTVPHGGDLAIVGPDNRIFNIIYWQDNAAPTQPMVDWEKFKTMKQLKLDIAQIKGLLRERDRNELVFTKTGWYRVLLSENLEAEASRIPRFECKVYYDHSGSNETRPSAGTPDQLGQILLRSNYNGISQGYDTYYADGPTSPTTKGGWHPGIDYRARTPLPIYFPINGVVDSMDSKGAGYGRVAVKIDGTNDYFIFLHLSEPSVKLGQKVVVSDIIGITGSTGAPGGPHLHVELRTGKNLAAYYFRSQADTGVNKDPSLIISSNPSTPSGRNPMSSLPEEIKQFLDTKYPSWKFYGSLQTAVRGHKM